MKLRYTFTYSRDPGRHPTGVAIYRAGKLEWYYPAYEQNHPTGRIPAWGWKLFELVWPL